MSACGAQSNDGCGCALLAGHPGLHRCAHGEWRTEPSPALMALLRELNTQTDNPMEGMLRKATADRRAARELRGEGDER